MEFLKIISKNKGILKNSYLFNGVITIILALFIIAEYWAVNIYSTYGVSIVIFVTLVFEMIKNIRENRVIEEKFSSKEGVENLNVYRFTRNIDFIVALFAIYAIGILLGSKF